MNSADLEWSILQGKPKTVDDAIKLALEYEAFQRGKRDRQSDFRPFRASEETLLNGTDSQYRPGQQQSNHGSSTVIGASQQPSNNSYNNKQCYRKGHEEIDCRMRRRLGGNKSCFYCGAQSHFIRNCEVRKNDLKISVPYTKQSERPNCNSEAAQSNPGNGC